MNLSWLEDFLALAGSGNFSRAAEERHMTQPAFSRRIRALEEWLGADLFDRSSQPARLTAAGEWLRPQAEQLLGRVARLPSEVRAVAQASAGTLRIAATHALSFSFVPGWLQTLQAYTQGGPIRLESDVLQRCEALLAQRQVQFVVAHAAGGALEEAGTPSVVVGRDELLPVAAPGAPEKALLAFSEESGLGRIVRGALGPELAGWQTVFTAHLASVLKGMALEGRGLAWLPETLVREEIAAGRLQLRGPGQWRIPLEVRLYRDPAPLGVYAEEFWGAVGSLARTHPTKPA
ncbi:LysR substrate-binding domain-containing protein [Ramlibacter sp. XY19]|uniref:LysR family transcriptional regulator n=1 Tax=Ramlibacter paludis TaxID=2908000 RepID=UPI0023DC4ACD|nr:LysR family transcriptional regulator [Ramlibacter paludis]MCG2593651.1 LysR substrate-binding domain-containing protein [Ramlibacter paludis]